jgi:DNA-binding beta-propeller fold protein YncE
MMYPKIARTFTLAMAFVPAASFAATTSPPAMHIVVDVPMDASTRRLEAQSFDSRSGQLFIADVAGGRVIVVDTKSNHIVTVIRDLPGVQSVLAVPELGRLYAVSPSSYEIAVIDEKTHAVVARLPGGRSPSAIAWDPVRHKVYISDEIGETETVIDSASNKRVATIPLGGEVGSTQFNRTENLVYVNVKTKNELIAIDPSQDIVVARYPLVSCIENTGLLIDDVNQLAYITCHGNARLVSFDLRSHRQRDTLPVNANSFAWDAATSRLYVVCERGKLALYSVAGRSLRKTTEVALGDDVFSISLSSATHRVYIALPDSAGRPVLRVLEPAYTTSPRRG